MTNSAQFVIGAVLFGLLVNWLAGPEIVSGPATFSGLVTTNRVGSV